jgi:hypothetical protein
MPRGWLFLLHRGHQVTVLTRAMIALCLPEHRDGVQVIRLRY